NKFLKSRFRNSLDVNYIYKSLHNVGKRSNFLIITYLKAKGRIYTNTNTITP
ncbi:hypothetical protein LZ30DRAFT_608113, partial [Colletotrichum cereale]